MKYALINSVIYTKNEVLRDYAVIIEGEYIQSVIPQSELESGIKIIDLKGHNLTAGFIDLQLNGCGGVMFNDQKNVEKLEIMTRESAERWLERLKSGVKVKEL